MAGVSLDWSSAKVHEGKLEVGLRGELPSGWKDSFERTIDLLPGGEWGKVRLKKDRVLVKKVADGDEDRLHHFLESVVLQANAAHEQSESEAGEDQDADDDQSDPVDVEMTERFRSFAPEPED